LRRGPSLTAYDVLALLLLVALATVTIVSLTRPHVLFLAHSPALANTIETAALLAALGATYVALGEFLLFGRLSSLCICLAFLVFLTSDAALGVLPLLTGWDRTPAAVCAPVSRGTIACTACTPPCRQIGAARTSSRTWSWVVTQTIEGSHPRLVASCSARWRICAARFRVVVTHATKGTGSGWA